MAPHTVAMFMLHSGSPRDQAARQDLATALPGAKVREPDDTGVFEVELEADDTEDALLQVWNAVAAAGADDHVVLLEHPDLPEHWRRRAGGPG
jgi:hypothetical protein